MRTSHTPLACWLLAVLCAGSLLMMAGCSDSTSAPSLDLSTATWDEIEAQAEGQTVNMAMWTGDPYINDYMRGYVTSTLKERYGITLNISSAQGNQIVSMLMTEREAGADQSEFDMMWINGETFYQLRQIDALYGPFVQALPNSRYIDLDNPFIANDFQQPIDGYECPWGNVQFLLIYDTTRTTRPPQTREELAAWVKANPGRFTFDVAFTGMTFLKMLLIDIAGEEALAGPFDEATYNQYAPQLWAYLDRIKPYLWKEGESFPQGVAQLHQLFVNGEVDFTMSNNDGEVDNKVQQGLFPESAQAYVPRFGSIQNSHYLGVSKAGPNKAGALVTINFLLSPEAQYRKMQPDVWGDGTVLARQKLPAEWQDEFEAVQQNREHAPPRDEIEGHALQELAPEYMIRLFDDFRREIIQP